MKPKNSMSIAEYRDTADDFSQSLEDPYMRAIMAHAEKCGWYVFHDEDSRRNQADFPDLILVKEPRLLVLEVKRTRGRLTAGQKVLLLKLVACGVDARAVWPKDWKALKEELAMGVDVVKADLDDLISRGIAKGFRRIQAQGVR